MKIDIPSLQAQQHTVFIESTKEAIKQLNDNLEAPAIAPQTEIDESTFSRNHLLRQDKGWEAPEPEIVRAYLDHFQAHFEAYNSDEKLAYLLGLGNDRNIRRYKNGDAKVPYSLWRKFLVLTGRAPQDVLPVLAYMG